MKSRVFTIGAGILAAAVVLFVFRGACSRNGTKQKETILTDVPVTVVPAIKQKLSSALSLVGTISASNDVNVVSETQGVAKAVYAKVGNRVASGTVLVQVDDEIPRSNLAAAEINHEKALRDFERSEALYQENSLSASQLDAARLGLKAAENQLDIAKRQVENTRIKSPIAGTVNARFVSVGSMVAAGTPVANVVDITTLKVKVNVTEREAFQLAPGDSVEMSVDVYPGVEFVGRVDNIASKADEAHTYAVEITVPNSSRHPLKAGLFARIGFLSIVPTESLVIPREALIGSIKDAQVFVVRGGVAHLLKIVIGKQTATHLEVLRGVGAGDSIVTSGQNNLVDESKVVVVNETEGTL